MRAWEQRDYDSVISNYTGMEIQSKPYSDWLKKDKDFWNSFLNMIIGESYFYRQQYRRATATLLNATYNTLPGLMASDLLVQIFLLEGDREKAEKIIRKLAAVDKPALSRLVEEAARQKLFVLTSRRIWDRFIMDRLSFYRFMTLGLIPSSAPTGGEPEKFFSSKSLRRRGKKTSGERGYRRRDKREFRDDEVSRPYSSFGASGSASGRGGADDFVPITVVPFHEYYLVTIDRTFFSSREARDYLRQFSPSVLPEVWLRGGRPQEGWRIQLGAFRSLRGAREWAAYQRSNLENAYNDPRARDFR